MQYDTLGRITGLMRRVAIAWGGKTGSVGGLWAAILGASTATQGGRALVVPPGSDAARERLARVLGRLDGSRKLISELAEGRVPPLVLRAAECQLTRADQAELTRLRDGLDRLSGRG